MEDVLGCQNATEDGSPMASIDNDDPYILDRYENFKKYGIVNDHSDHLIGRRRKKPERYPLDAVSEVRECFQKELPGTERIYVRVYEPMMDIFRAVIIGGEGTPYHDGLFFFDVLIPCQYGSPYCSTPTMRYHSPGLHIHPNIKKCGEVVYHLYKKSGDGSFQREELWVPGGMLQLLLTIRDEFLNKNPLFWASGYYGECVSSDDAQESSLLYNENIIINSLKTMTHVMNKPPKHFEDLVVGHFRSRVRHILMACKGYIMEGKFLEGKEEGRCSLGFRNDVASCIKPLVKAFMKIGAKEAREFRYLE